MLAQPTALPRTILNPTPRRLSPTHSQAHHDPIPPTDLLTSLHCAPRITTLTSRGCAYALRPKLTTIALPMTPGTPCRTISCAARDSGQTMLPRSARHLIGPTVWLSGGAAGWHDACPSPRRRRDTRRSPLEPLVRPQYPKSRLPLRLSNSMRVDRLDRAPSCAG
jgi:hypothetical protein